MTDYRMYCLDGVGKIGSGEWIEAKNDDEALIGRGKFRWKPHISARQGTAGDVSTAILKS